MNHGTQKSFLQHLKTRVPNYLIFSDPFLRNSLWSNYLLHLQPLDEHQSLALLDLVKEMEWSSVALISSMDSYGKTANNPNIKHLTFGNLKFPQIIIKK